MALASNTKIVWFFFALERASDRIGSYVNAEPLPELKVNIELIVLQHLYQNNFAFLYIRKRIVFLPMHQIFL